MSEAMDAKYGAGQWRCDDLWKAKTLPACAQAYLDIARAPVVEKLGKPVPPLFATFEGIRVRVVMASRFGDVGITSDLKAENGYERRVLIPQLTDFSGEP